MEGESEVRGSPNINSVLKPSKARIPLQEIVISTQDDENTATRKRRVSFANVNKIKEFSSVAESLVVCHTPAYEEPFSVSSDSSYPGANGSSLTKQRSTTNIEDATLETMDITSGFNIHQSNLRDSSILLPKTEFIPDLETFGENSNLTDLSSKPLCSSAETLDLTKTVSSRIIVGNAYPNKSHQISSKSHRYSASCMDITKEVRSNILFNYDCASIDSLKYSESKLDLTNPVVSNITNGNENTRFSVSGMDLTKIKERTNLYLSCNEEYSNKTTDEIDTHHSSNLEFTDAINEPNMFGISTIIDSTVDMDFTKCIVQNDHTRYSTKMDFTDIINDDESELSEKAMNFTKSLDNVNDQNYISNIDVIAQQSQLHEMCSSTSESLDIEDSSFFKYNDCLNTVNIDKAHDKKPNLHGSSNMQKSISTSNMKDKEHFPSVVLTTSIIDINKPCKVALECTRQNTSCNEAESLEMKNMVVHINTSDSECSSSNKSIEDVTNENVLESKTVGLETSNVKFQEEYSQNNTFNVGNGLLPLLKMKENNGLTLKNNIIKTEPNSTDCTYSSDNIEHNHHVDKGICVGIQTNSISKESLSNRVSPPQNNIKDNDTLKINTFQMHDSEIEIPLSINNSVGHDNSETERIQSNEPSDTHINPNISTTDNISVNISIQDEMCKKNITIQRGGSTMLYSTPSISDNETEYPKGETINSLCDVDDSTVELISSHQHIQSNQGNGDLNGADFSNCKDESFDKCEDISGPTKGAKRSFEVALESENDTEESPIKLMCIKPNEQMNKSEGLLNVSDLPLISHTIKHPIKTNNGLILTESNENIECLEKLCNAGESSELLEEKYLFKERHKSIISLPSDRSYLEEMSLVPTDLNEANKINDGTNTNRIFFESDKILKLDSGMYTCDLIPKWIQLQFHLDYKGFITTRTYNMICSEKDIPIGEYLLNQIKSSAIPEHVSELVQHMKEPRDNFLSEFATTLSFICKYHNGNVNDNMLTIEMNSCKKHFWIFVVINLKYPQLLSPTDISIYKRNIGDIKLSTIRQMFTSLQRRELQLMRFTGALMNLQYE